MFVFILLLFVALLLLTTLFARHSGIRRANQPKRQLGRLDSSGHEERKFFFLFSILCDFPNYFVLANIPCVFMKLEYNSMIALALASKGLTNNSMLKKEASKLGRCFETSWTYHA